LFIPIDTACSAVEETGSEDSRFNQLTNSDTLFPNWRVAGGR